MEINSTHKGQGKGNPTGPSHKIIFFNNQASDSSAYKKDHSHDYFDEQEIPQNKGESSEGTPNDSDEEFLQNEYNCQGNKIPTKSNEMYNAFIGEHQQREHKTFGVPQALTQTQKWKDEQNHKRVASQNYQNYQYQNAQTKKSQPPQVYQVNQQKPELSNRAPQLSNIQIYRNQPESQTKFKNFFQSDPNSPPQRDYQLREVEVEPEEEDEEEEEDDIDQEHHMATEQDLEGHDDQELDQSHQQQDEDEESFGESRVEQDNHSNFYEGREQEVLSQGEDENIPVSSQSVSPDEKHPLTNEGEYFENEDTVEDEFNDVARTSQQTGKSSDFKFNNNGNVVVERNDRFIIFKMVPQSNTRQSIANPSGHNSVRHPLQQQIKDQPTPLIGEKQDDFHKNKFYRETVEDMASSHSEDEEAHQLRQDGKRGGYPQFKGTTKSKLIQQTYNRGGPSKPQVPAKQACADDSADMHLVKSNKKGNALSKKLQSQTAVNYDQQSSTEEHKQTEFKNSFGSFSRSSSDKFNRLQKLEKKNLQEEIMDNSEFTMTKSNLTKVLRQQNNQPKVYESQQVVEPMKMLERRQSESTAMSKGSQHNQHSFGKSETAVGYQVSGQRSGEANAAISTQQNTASTNVQVDSQNDPETELLKMEYMKLKMTLNKLKHEPQKTGGRTVNTGPASGKPLKNPAPKGNQIPPRQITTKPQPESKSKKNLQLETHGEGIHSNLLNSFLSDEQLGVPSSDVSKIKKQGGKPPGLFSVQASTKNKDGENKSAFHKKQQQTVTKRDNSKFSHKQSPRGVEQRPKQNNSKTRAVAHRHRRENQAEYDSEDERENRSHTNSPDKSYLTYQRPQNKTHLGTNRHTTKQKSKQVIKKHRHHGRQNDSPQSSNEGSEYSQEDDASIENADGSYSFENSNNREGSSDEDEEHRSDSYYDSNDEEEHDDEEQYYSESGSQEHSDSQQSDSEDSQHRHHKRKHGSKNPKGQMQREKSQKNSQRAGGHKIQTKSTRDGKLKININMHGRKYSRQKQQQHQKSQEDYISKQMQMLQQQQYMLPIAAQYQHQQQQLILQQQLALQQQMMMQHQQPQALQAQLYNQAAIAPLIQPPLVQKTIVSAPPHYNQPLSSNASILQPQVQVIHEEQVEASRNLQRNASGRSLHYGNPPRQAVSTYDYVNSNVSPKRDFPLGKGYLPQNNHLNQIRSPREMSENPLKYNIDSTTHSVGQQNNYLNQLKNRFRTGAPGNPLDDREETQYFEEQVSRNIPRNITQANSSPLTGMQQRNQPSNFRGDQTHAAEGDLRNLNNFSQFEEARRFLIHTENQQSHRHLYQDPKHSRTESYMNRLDAAEENQPANRGDNYNRQKGNQLNTHQSFEERNMQNQEENDDYWHPATDRPRNYQQPRLEPKRTGDFPRPIDRSPDASPDFLNIPKQDKGDRIFNRPISRGSPDQAGDLSIDEGVKASITRQTIQKSPKATNLESQFTIVKKEPRKFSELESLPPLSETSQKKNSKKKEEITKEKNEQDKKGPQAIIIGFDDIDIKGVNPFSNKPALKAREKKDLMQRSKSTKGTTPSVKGGAPQQKTTAFNQRRSPDQRNTNTKTASLQDQQMVSPREGTSEKKQQQVVSPNILTQKQSPLKRAVYDIKLKESINEQSSAKSKQSISITKDMPKSSLSQWQESQEAVKKQMKAQPASITINLGDDDEEDLDPNHNKGLVIEILDKKRAAAAMKEVSLAEMFKAKRKDALISQEQPVEQDKQQNVKLQLRVQDVNQDDQDRAQSSARAVPEKKEKTKEELAEIRKAMMKNRPKAKHNNFSNQESNAPGSSGFNQSVVDGGVMSKQKKQQQVSDNLMLRLALGKKVQVDKKEMKKLTKQNYENLPEIKKKKEEEQKKQDHLNRKVAAQQYMKEFNEKRKLMLKKKKSNVEDD